MTLQEQLCYTSQNAVQSPVFCYKIKRIKIRVVRMTEQLGLFAFCTLNICQILVPFNSMQVITELSAHYCGRLQTHPNHLAHMLIEDEEETRRLKRFKLSELTTTLSQTTHTPRCPVIALDCQSKAPTSVRCFLYTEYSLEYFFPRREYVHLSITFILCTYYPCGQRVRLLEVIKKKNRGVQLRITLTVL